MHVANMLMVKQYRAAPLKRCSVILIAYDIYDDRVTVLVVQAEEHYNDK